jgi:PAS domain S-box-containing protein
LKIFGANVLGIVALFPLIVGKVQLEYFHETNKTRNRREYSAIIILVLAIFGTTVFAWHATSTSLAEKNNERFEALAEESEKALKNRLLSYEDAILGGAGLFYASEEVSRAEWREYVKALDVVNRYPGINGIGYIGRVPEEEVAGYVAEQRTTWRPDFRSHPEVENNTYYIITYIEPVDINGPAVGLNIAFEANRKAAAELAANTGKSAITQRILLVQDAEKTPGFLLLFPIYNNGVFTAQTNPETDLLGWVYAPFIGKNLLGDLTASQGERIGLNIYDGATADANKLIYSEDGRLEAGENDRPLFKKTATFNIMQQDWTIEWVSTPLFEDSTIDFQAELILITGIVIGGLLGLMLISIAHRAASIQTEVERKTEEINKARGGLQAVLDTVVDGIVELSAGGRILAFNPSAERIFGHKAEDVIDKSFANLLVKFDRPKLKAYLNNDDKVDFEVMANGITISGKRKDGTTFPIELAASAVKTSETRRLVASVRDITDQVAAQKALELSEKTFRQTLENAPIAALSISPERELIHMNKTANAMLGYTMEELQDPAILLAHPDDTEVDAEQLAELVNGTAQNFAVEKRLITKSGETIWVEQHVSPVYDAEGTVKYFIKQMINLTERKKTERIKNEFIATVSHELRTPITSISGSLSLILGAFKDEISPKVHGLLTIAQRNSSRLIGLVNDILDMEKLGNGGMHYEMTDVKLADSLQRIVEDNKSYAATYEADLVLDPVSTDTEIMVDEWRFNQVLSNFISNAVKFSKAGGTVRIRTQEIEDRIRIEVVDNGIGISEEFQNRIFTKFAQADSSTTRKKDGTGLGLMISKQLVEQMGGEIGYSSEPNVETSFWAEFKILSEEDKELQTQRKAG